MTRFIDIYGFAAKGHAMSIHPQCTAEELVEVRSDRIISAVYCKVCRENAMYELGIY